MVGTGTGGHKTLLVERPGRTFLCCHLAVLTMLSSAAAHLLATAGLSMGMII